MKAKFIYLLLFFLMLSINLAYSQTYNCYDFDEISNDYSIVFRKGDTILVYKLPSSQYVKISDSQYTREHVTETKTDSLIEFIKERLSGLNFYLWIHNEECDFANMKWSGNKLKSYFHEAGDIKMNRVEVIPYGNIFRYSYLLKRAEEQKKHIAESDPCLEYPIIEIILR